MGAGEPMSWLLLSLGHHGGGHSVLLRLKAVSTGIPRSRVSSSSERDDTVVWDT